MKNKILRLALAMAIITGIGTSCVRPPHHDGDRRHDRHHDAPPPPPGHY